MFPLNRWTFVPLCRSRLWGSLYSRKNPLPYRVHLERTKGQSHRLHFMPDFSNSSYSFRLHFTYLDGLHQLRSPSNYINSGLLLKKFKYLSLLIYIHFLIILNYFPLFISFAYSISSFKARSSISFAFYSYCPSPVP